MTPRTFPRLLRQAAAALALAALLATAGVASSASALSTSTLIITKLAEASIDTTVGTSDMAIDSQAGRGYIANYTRNSVDVFDVSGATLRRIATIVTGLVNPRSIAVDSVNHRVYVAERNSRAIKVVDGDPTSATVNQVTSTIATTAQPRTMAVDTTNGRLFVGSEFAETIDLIDLRDGSLSKIPINATTAGQGKPMTIDPSTSTVFVGLSTDPLITVIKSDLSRTEGSITSGTDQMQFVGGALIAAQSTMAGMALMKFDPETLAAAATSPLLQSNTGIRRGADPGLDRIYLSYVDSHVEVFSGADLSRDGIVQLDADAIAVNADIKTHRLFVVSPGATVLTMYAVEPRGKPVVERIAGVDRYEGSAKVSAARFAPMTGTAYVASGEGFADALSASAAAGADGGPVLLVQKNVVPLSIIAELRRLKPQRIVIVGGPLTVSEDVEKELGRFSASVSRVTGTDRFDVSANLSRGVFKSGKAVAYVASGLVFPDALSGSAAAGKNGSPVLLVQPDAVPTSVELELKRLAPAQIVVLGGRNTVSDPVLTQLNRIAPTSRTSGADRFDGSAAISAANFPAENPLVFVASGAVFPDALSGSAAAIAAGSPVLLVSKDTMAASIDRELDRLLPSKIIVLGGTGTISDAVLTALRDH